PTTSTTGRNNTISTTPPAPTRPGNDLWCPPFTTVRILPFEACVRWIHAAAGVRKLSPKTLALKQDRKRHCAVYRLTTNNRNLNGNTLAHTRKSMWFHNKKAVPGME
ncbi:unnamed protein product, partial [Ectocarpus sp. 8 AP-2014]